MPVDSTDTLVTIGIIFVLGVPLFIVYRLLRFRKMLRECIAEKLGYGKRSPFRALIPCCETVTPRAFADGWQALYPHAGEVFFPRPPHIGALIEIEIAGTCKYHHGYKKLERADAFYRTDQGRFVERHRELRIDDKDLPNWTTKYELETYKKFFEIVETHRGDHYYRVLLELNHPGHQVGIAFADAAEYHVHADLECLRVRVTPLPADTASIAARQERERRRQEAKQEAIAAAEQFARAVRSLSITSFVSRNWEDPEYCAKFARAHCEQLIQNQAQIRREAMAFLEQHELVAYLRKHNPSAVKTILGRLEALLMAERVALDRAIVAAEASKPILPLQPEPPPAPAKKKLTTEEVRAIKIRRQKVQDLDKVGLKLDKIETRLQVRDRLNALPLDQDERDMLEQELFREIDAEGDDDAKTI